jgi:hypothetical protein
VEERYRFEVSSGDVDLTPSAVSGVGFDRFVDAVVVIAAAVAVVALVAAATVAAVDTFSVASVFEPASTLLQ